MPLGSERTIKREKSGPFYGAAKTLKALENAGAVSAAALAASNGRSLGSLEREAYLNSHPLLRPGQRPEYFEWKDMCGHATMVDETVGVQICNGNCPFAVTDHGLVKAQRKGDRTLCELEAYRLMKEIQNMF
jgi:hypothetical protein